MTVESLVNELHALVPLYNNGLRRSNVFAQQLKLVQALSAVVADDFTQLSYMTHTLMIEVYLQSGALQKGVEHFPACMAKIDKIQDDEQRSIYKAKMSFLYGAVLREKELDYVGSIATYKQALQACEHFKAQHEIYYLSAANILRDYGIAYLKIKNFVLAREAFLEAIEITNKSDQMQLFSIALKNYLALANLRLAESQSKKEEVSLSLALFAEVERAYDIALPTVELKEQCQDYISHVSHCAQALSLTGEDEKAIYQWITVFTIRNKLPGYLKSRAADNAEAIAETYLRLADKKTEEKKHYLQSALKWLLTAKLIYHGLALTFITKVNQLNARIKPLEIEAGYNPHQIFQPVSSKLESKEENILRLNY